VQPRALDLWTSQPSNPPFATAIFSAAALLTTRARFTSTESAGFPAASEWQVPINIKVLIEGEEEVAVSASGLRPEKQGKAQSRRARRLRYFHAWQGVPSITYGLRGLITTRSVDRPERDLHSGVYGGAVPNPLTILPSFRQASRQEFSCHCPGFYDSVAKVPNAERKALNALPWKKKDFEKASERPAMSAKPLHHSRAALDAPDLRIERIWAAIREKAPRPSFRQKPLLNFQRASSPTRIPTRSQIVEKHSKASSQDRPLQVRSIEHRKTVGRSYNNPIFKQASLLWKKASAGKPFSFAKAAPSLCQQMHDTFKVRAFCSVSAPR